MSRFLAAICLTTALAAGCGPAFKYQDPNEASGGGGGEESGGGGGGGGGGDGEMTDERGQATTPDARGFLSMPFVTTLSEAEARATMKRSQMTGNIRVDLVDCLDKTIPSGHVCNTYPGGGEKTSTTSDVVLFIVK